MQSGILVAVSDFSMKDGGADNNTLLRHNLPATGGASGSPVFNTSGQIIGVLFAMNSVHQKDKTGTENGQRTPSGAMINFAIRADLLDSMGKMVPVADFLK